MFTVFCVCVLKSIIKILLKNKQKTVSHTVAKGRGAKQAKATYLEFGLCVDASSTPPYHFLPGNNTMNTGVPLQAYQVTGTGRHGKLQAH